MRGAQTRVSVPHCSPPVAAALLHAQKDVAQTLLSDVAQTLLSVQGRATR
jgi:hypothetical protein